MKKIPILISFALFMVLLVPVGSSSPASITRSVVTPSTQQPLLSMKLLSTSISGCSQVGNVNATWLGPAYYAVSPSSFVLLSKTRNTAYGNGSDVAYPNEQSQWFLFSGVPITLQVSFEFCAAPNTETLVYTDPQTTLILT